MKNGLKVKSNYHVSTYKGFTIVELSIASAVFSVVLLVALTAFLQIGRIYYKGISVTQTQETASQILNDISGNLETATTVSSVQNRGSWQYFCIGDVRYTYYIGSAVDSTNIASELSDGNQIGFIRDALPHGGGICPAPCPTNSCGPNEVTWTAPDHNPTEMLSNKMRIEYLNFSQPDPINSANLYNIQIVVFYGDSDLEQFDTPGDPRTATCKQQIGSQFCAIANYSTSLFRSKST
jgi:prepilin-type N-terminal cleavage/methylation domain-containing protein